MPPVDSRRMNIACAHGRKLGAEFGKTEKCHRPYFFVFACLYYKSDHIIRGVHPPETMMHFPPDSDFPLFQKIFRTVWEFFRFYLFPYFRCFSTSSLLFSLFHQRADDEALTRFLQTSLFLVASPILVKSMFLSFRSSLTLSIQVFLCLPL